MSKVVPLRPWTLPPQKGVDLEPAINSSKEQPKGKITIVDVFQHGNSLNLEAFSEEDSCVYVATLWDYLNESLSWRKLSAIAFEVEKLHNSGQRPPELFWVRKDVWLKKQPPVPIQ